MTKNTNIDTDDMEYIAVSHFNPPSSYNTSCVGSYMTKISNHRLLSKQEEERLGKTIQDSTGPEKDNAIIELMEHNLKLAASIAAHYQNRGLDLEDLISEANIGLRKAAERFNPKHDAKFSTYACHWIKQSIIRSIHKKSRTVRLPTHLIEKVAKLKKVQESITRTLGREPSNQELCFETGNKEKVVEKLLNVHYQTTSINQSSLTQNDGEEDLDILKSLADPNQLSPCEEVSKDNDTNCLPSMLKTLSQREQTILKMRYGLEDSKPLTLEEVGKNLSLSRERIRQIENAAIDKLKKLKEV